MKKYEPEYYYHVRDLITMDSTEYAVDPTEIENFTTFLTDLQKKLEASSESKFIVYESEDDRIHNAAVSIGIDLWGIPEGDKV
jgi:hypothetical protein